MAPPSQDDDPTRPEPIRPEPIRPEIVAGGPIGDDAEPEGLEPEGLEGRGFDLSSLLDSAQQLMSAQQEAAESELVGSAGGGKGEGTVTGGGEFRHVRISPDVVAPADVSLLEDLVLAALRDAMARINAAQSAALGGL